MASKTAFSASRRSFLRLPEKQDETPIRPPWTDEKRVLASCTSCEACIEACPQNILVQDQNGHPTVVFGTDECTFCNKCADACEAEVFDLTRDPPWPYKAELKSGCLQEHGISCHLCRDICPQSAIKIDLQKRPFGRLRIDTTICTGCGACVSSCPQDVLEITRQVELELA